MRATSRNKLLMLMAALSIVTAVAACSVTVDPSPVGKAGPEGEARPNTTAP